MLTKQPGGAGWTEQQNAPFRSG